MSDPKSEYRRTANQIGELELERRAAIMAGDDRQAEQFDFDLFAAKLRLKRLADKIDWLEQEQHAQAAANALPDSVAALRQEIQNAINRGASGVMATDFVVGTAAPTVSTDFEFRFNTTDQNSIAIKIVDAIIALKSIRRALETTDSNVNVITIPTL
jgi:hypothetical protein